MNTKKVFLGEVYDFYYKFYNEPGQPYIHNNYGVEYKYLGYKPLYYISKNKFYNIENGKIYVLVDESGYIIEINDIWDVISFVPRSIMGLIELLFDIRYDIIMDAADYEEKEKAKMKYDYVLYKTLIPYEAFYKHNVFSEKNLGEFINNCNEASKKLNKYKKLQEKRNKIEYYKNRYSYDYTKEEIEEIHVRGELTLDEKVEEIITETELDLESTICLNDEVFKILCDDPSGDCIKCSYRTLYETGKKSFEPRGRGLGLYPSADRNYQKD